METLAGKMISMELSTYMLLGALIGSFISLINPHPVSFFIGAMIGTVFGVIWYPGSKKRDKPKGDNDNGK